ncbi:MAG TPA: beta-glucosidase BglX [Bacteroidales bacterium]|nr:beta-glucosidase BglX [Bacteroidales bacterium]
MNRIKIVLFALLLAGISCTEKQSTGDIEMDTFLDGLMGKMTLYEKLGQLNLSSGAGNSPVISAGDGMPDLVRKGLIGASGSKKDQEIAVNESRLKIPLLSGRDIIHGCYTTFPIPLALSCMWDMERIEQSAQIAASEASTIGINWTYSPMVDICRDPRWGRIAEGGGEDPWLGSQIAKAYVRGYQGDDLTKENTIMACIKHFALYGAAVAGRDYNTVDMSRLSMYQDYMPPYRAAVDAGAGSVMTSFNLVDGIPATGNKWLLDDLLRKQWGFNGFIVTDFTAINEMINHGMGDLQEVSALALKAGVDMDMVGEGFIGTLEKSMKEGKVTQQEIDQACRRILEAKYKLGLFDEPFKYFDDERKEEVVLSKENKQAAREIASRSMVLLKNDNQTLPLKKEGTIAVIGPLAKVKAELHGTWAFWDDTTHVVSVYEGLQNAVEDKAKLVYAKGSEFTQDYHLLNAYRMYEPKEILPNSIESARLIKEAVAVAKKSDVVIAVLGEPNGWSGEASCRADISIPECQRELLRELLGLGKPVVLVLVNGRPLTLTWENEQVDAMLEAWHGGIEAGNAIADVLFGDYNPSGKLTATFPRSVGQIPVYYNHKNTGRPNTPEDPYTSRYLDLPNDPLFPFGYGLSYTTFEYSDITMNKISLKGDETLQASVIVENTGNYEGEEVVQLYINDPVASVSRSVKELKGYEKIKLAPGEKKEVIFNITTEELKFFNSDLKYDWESGDFNIYIGTNSTDCKHAVVNWEK